MISKIKYVVLIFLWVFVYACSADYDEAYIDSQIVVDGVLFPDEKPVIRLVQLADINDNVQLPVVDAIVSIYSNNQKYNLELSDKNIGEYSYEGTDLQISTGNYYSLEIEYFGNMIFAETIIPYPPENIELELYEYEDSLLVDTVSFINIEWDHSGDAYFYTILHCDSLNPLADNYCYYHINDEFPCYENYQFIDTAGLINENVYTVTVFSMTEEYAMYYYSYEPAGSDFGYSGNVENAYGIFTGLSSTSVVFQYFTDSLSIIGE